MTPLHCQDETASQLTNMEELITCSKPLSNTFKQSKDIWQISTSVYYSLD